MIIPQPTQIFGVILDAVHSFNSVSYSSQSSRPTLKHLPLLTEKKKKADTTIDLQFWSEDQAIKNRITWCILHIYHMWYFLSILCIWRYFPNVNLSEGSQDNRYRLVIFDCRESASHFYSTCTGTERMAL